MDWELVAFQLSAHAVYTAVSQHGQNLNLPTAFTDGLLDLVRENMRAVMRLDMPKGDPRFHAILQELADLHAKKNADYGSGDDCLANCRASEAWGVPAWVGTMIRGCDKIKRLQSLVENGKLENESAEDSLLDLAAYSVIALIFLREQKDLAEKATS